MKVGEWCSFYHEGGHGERHWVRGWRCGVIVATPARGAKKNWVHIEIRVPRMRFDLDTRQYVSLPFERAWVHSSCVNALGDVTYHGQKLTEQVAERKAAKIKDEVKAVKATRRAGVQAKAPRSRTAKSR